MIARLANAAKEVAIAYQFGTGPLIDAYVLVVAFVTWLPAVWLSGCQTVLVPQVVSLSAAERRLFLSELFGWLIVVGAVLSLVLILGLPTLMMGLFGDHAARNELEHLLAVLTPITLFGVVTSLFIALLIAAQRHANALLEGVPAVVILVSVLLLGSAQALSYGTLAGFALQLGVAAWLLRTSWFSRPKLSFASSVWPEFKQGMKIVLFGQLLLALAYPVDQLIANTLVSGSGAQYGYAYRLVAFIMAIGSLAIGRTVLPVLSQMDLGDAWLLVARWGWRLFSSAIFVVALAWALAPWGVALLFERGAFTQSDTLAVTEAFRWGLVQVPFMLLGVLLMQYLASAKAFWTISLVGAGGAVVKIGASLVLGNTLGLPGLMQASAVAFGVTALAAYVGARRLVRVT